MRQASCDRIDTAQWSSKHTASAPIPCMPVAQRCTLATAKHASMAAHSFLVSFALNTKTGSKSNLDNTSRASSGGPTCGNLKELSICATTVTRGSGAP
mmetsp:Transcript_145/g.512  ORF Transcript_145/g.512 Transcript_145/m.512 type:complete len:98 (-) Transcript_145:79-372(-)|eukprot:scaffold206118_cov35-Tisochrysis_lutea.AAC.1